jgi:dihydrofolate reductase
MKVSIIVAAGENGVIGRGNALPWRLPADLKRFKQITLGHAIIMGRRTWDSIGRALPGRTSIVVTRQRDFEPPAPGVIVVNSFEAALAHAEALGETEVFVIGGRAIYELALPWARRIYMTRVHGSFEGDVFLPEGALRGFEIRGEERREADDRNPYPMTFQVLERDAATT